MKGLKGECGEISLSILFFFIVNTWRWRVNHIWLKIAGKDSQYRNQFTQQSSHLREFNERRGDTLQVPTVRLVVCPQETVLLMCIPVSVQATLVPTWDREHAQRGCQWNPASDSRQRRNSIEDHIPFIQGMTDVRPLIRNHQKPNSMLISSMHLRPGIPAPGPLPALKLPSEQLGPELLAPLLLPAAAAGPAELLPWVWEQKPK